MTSFNRRGDSLGGAARKSIKTKIGDDRVSIAGAILWGVLRDFIGIPVFANDVVSIAGAILWGVLLMAIVVKRIGQHVSIAGAILWGVLPRRLTSVKKSFLFQSQGRFFGGCCLVDSWYKSGILVVSIAGAILWGVLH